MGELFGEMRKNVYLCITTNKHPQIMNVATRTIQLTIPESDVCTAERISKGMGWEICIMNAADNVDERKKDAEAFARKLSVTDEDFEELKSHGFYMHEMPEQSPSFASEDEEIAYLDSLDEEGYLSEEESAKHMEIWRNL